MQKADAVVCNSYDFTKRAKKYNQNSYYIGNGFDASQYAAGKENLLPDDLQNIPGPVIGYVGALITLRLDLSLMVDLAKARPSWSFVLIGWEDEAFMKSELHGLSNVYFLGRKHTQQVPAYISNFDVCLNPQILNEITIGNFPLKVVEYLALGKPVVATSTNTMKELFSEHTYLAAGLEGYIQQINKALSENNEERQRERILFSLQFTWEKVVENLLKSICSDKKDFVVH
jgi:glycosyltransferase involved in cell wall biosynthesis